MKKKIKVAIIGLGYVGLPLLLLINKYCDVLGFDNNSEKINLLKKKKSYISDINNRELNKINSNVFCNINEYKKLEYCNYIIICLPTPLKNNKPDLSYLENCFLDIEKYLRKHQTIILESSVFTGATKKIFEKKLSKKFMIGRNFYLCYSPERIDPGKDVDFKKTEYQNITKLISGYSTKCLNKIYKLYKIIFKKIYKCESIEIAETAKLLENIYRSVNIGLVNEMKIISDKLNLNIHQIIEAAGSKPFGFRKFSPGPGVGGHCIPIDPIYMSWLAKKNNVVSNFIDLSVKVNLKITYWTLKKIIKEIDNKKKNILILGLTYKKDVNDLRESPSLKIFKLLISKKYNVSYQDPYIKNIYCNGKKFASQNPKNYKRYDYVILLTDHSAFNYKKIFKESNLIMDTRGKYKHKNSLKIRHI